MPATVYVVARFVAKPGKEDELKAVLTGLVPPTRRELGCYQYDLLTQADEPRRLCFVERWDGDVAFERHLETSHVTQTLQRVEDLIEEPPEIRRYRLV
jgi:quinol monooxygenase YgiN